MTKEELYEIAREKGWSEESLAGRWEVYEKMLELLTAHSIEEIDSSFIEQFLSDPEVTFST